ncbi:ACT domain-containing protein [Microcoleus sp. A003_D6]|uniref:ACT domain-containing protein n=1 Tax=Microcoleus sp. A003_D6 TaxID=3055266 RepID=UPI002FCE99DB
MATLETWFFTLTQRCHKIDGILTRDIAFTVAQIDAESAKNTLEKSAVELGWGEVAVDKQIAKVSVVGFGMVAHPGVAAKMFEALSGRQINIQ